MKKIIFFISVIVIFFNLNNLTAQVTLVDTSGLKAKVYAGMLGIQGFHYSNNKEFSDTWIGTFRVGGYAHKDFGKWYFVTNGVVEAGNGFKKPVTIIGNSYVGLKANEITSIQIGGITPAMTNTFRPWPMTMASQIEFATQSLLVVGMPGVNINTTTGKVSILYSFGYREYKNGAGLGSTWAQEQHLVVSTNIVKAGVMYSRKASQFALSADAGRLFIVTTMAVNGDMFDEGFSNLPRRNGFAWSYKISDNWATLGDVVYNSNGTSKDKFGKIEVGVEYKIEKSIFEADIFLTYLYKTDELGGYTNGLTLSFLMGIRDSKKKK